MNDTFASARGRLRRIRADAILFAVGESSPRAVWLPIATIHPEDQLHLKSKRDGDFATLRIRKWKADECGIAVGRDSKAAVRDFFDDSGGVGIK